MKKFLFLVAMLAAFGTQSMAQQGDDFGQHVVDESYADISLRWDTHSRLGVFVTIFEANERYVVCAATTNGSGTRNRQALRALGITLNGDVILRGFTWAPNHRRNVNSGMPIGSESACRITDAHVVANPEFDTDMNRTRF